MSRVAPDLFNDNLENNVIKPFFAIEMLFDGDETLRLWTGKGELEYEGNSWFGAGDVLSFSVVTETSEMAAEGAVVTLSGVSTALVSLALQEPYQGRRARVYFGLHLNQQVVSLVDREGNLLVDDEGRAYIGNYGPSDEETLVEIFSGFMDQMNIEEGPELSTIELTIENKLLALEKSASVRYTDAYQQYLYPNDKGFEYLEALEDQEITWGA